MRRDGLPGLTGPLSAPRRSWGALAAIVIAGLGVTAGVESMLGPLAAAYVLILAVIAPLLMRFSHDLHDRVAAWRSKAEAAARFTRRHRQ